MKASSWHRQPPLSWAFCIQVIPATRLMLSTQRVFCLPCFLFPSLGYHSVTNFVQRPPCLLATCPAHLHLSFAAASRTSVTLVCCLILEFLFLSFRVIFNIALSIAAWVTRSLFLCFFVVFQTSHPYVKTGRMYWLKVCFYRHTGMSLLKISFALLNACHPSMHLLCISLFMLSLVLTKWLR